MGVGACVGVGVRQGGGGGHRTDSWHTVRCSPQCVCGPQCELDMQTPGTEFNHQSGHNYSGESVQSVSHSLLCNS